MEAQEVRVKNLEDKIRALEEEIRTIKKDSSDSHKEIYDRLRGLETESAVAAERYKNIMDQLSSQNDQLSVIMASIEDLRKKPERRYETAVNSFISAAVGAVMGYLGTKFFGGN